MQITPSSHLLSALSAFTQTAKGQPAAASPVAPITATQTRAAPQQVASLAKPQAVDPAASPFSPKRHQPLGQAIDIRV